MIYTYNANASTSQRVDAVRHQRNVSENRGFGHGPVVALLVRPCRLPATLKDTPVYALLGALHNGEYVMSRMCVSINSRQAASVNSAASAVDDPTIQMPQRRGSEPADNHGNQRSIGTCV